MLVYIVFQGIHSVNQVEEGETAERRLQMELKEENDALRLQRESEWVSVLIVGKLK